MYATPQKGGGFSVLALTGREAAADPLSPCPPSALKSAAKRMLVVPASAIKGGPIGFSRAIDHFNLMERVTALEKELATSKECITDLSNQLQQRPAALSVDADAEAGDVAEYGDAACMNREELLCQGLPGCQGCLALRGDLAAEQQARRAAHNALVDLKGSVRVYCRVRPAVAGQSDTAVSAERSGLSVSCNGQQHTFSFNNVFGPTASQNAVFDSVSELVQSSLDGYHVCLFSYGQTGSGKTHNMTGMRSAEGRGIIPRAVDKILQECKRLRLQGWSYSIEACCLEIYNDRIRDIIADGDGSAPESTAGGPSHSVKEISDMNAIKHNADGSSHTHVVGVSRVAISSTEQAMALLAGAAANRASNATAMNSASSRSHSVFMLNISGHHAENNKKLMGALCLVDLAGSERLDRSKAEGKRKTEACAINQSLSSLGDVFDALSSRSKHVPYRNSKLTYLLKPCLSPGGKVLMFVHAAPEPESAYETLTSLRFAVKVAGVEVGPAQRNMTVNGLSHLPPSRSPQPASALQPKLHLPVTDANMPSVAGTSRGLEEASGAPAAEDGPRRSSRRHPQHQQPVAAVGAGRAPGRRVLTSSQQQNVREKLDLRGFFKQKGSDLLHHGQGAASELHKLRGKVAKNKKGGTWL